MEVFSCCISSLNKYSEGHEQRMKIGEKMMGFEEEKRRHKTVVQETKRVNGIKAHHIIAWQHKGPT